MYIYIITDCGEPCPGNGNWNTMCTRCECSGNTLAGRVLSTSHTPQAGVIISSTHAPYDVITTTNNGGTFTIPSACMGEILLFKKKGYVDEVHHVTTLTEPAQVFLTLIGKLPSIKM